MRPSPTAFLSVAGVALALLPLTVVAQSAPFTHPPARDAHGILVERGPGDGTPSAGHTLPALRVAVGADVAPSTAARLPLLEAIAHDYLGWGAVDDMSHWAPFLCRQPLPAGMHPSAAEHAGAHAGKLYRLFASSRRDYERATSDRAAADRAPDGLVVVKESFVAEPAQRTDPVDAHWDYQRSTYAQRDGQWFRRGAFAGLFVMARLPLATPDTDRGWLYATVSPDGQVTAAGRVASCMGCHERAPHGRLFGAARDGLPLRTP